MPISSRAYSQMNPFLPNQPRMSMEDDLFAELLGGLSKPYEVHSKRLYEYAVLEDGIENATDDFVKALQEAMEKSKGVAGDIDLTKLNRPVIIQVKAKNSGHPNVLKMLEFLQKNLSSSGRALVVYPAVEELSNLGGALARDLRSALKLTGIVPPLAVDSEISEAFCRATRELFDIQLKTPVRFVGPRSAHRVPVTNISTLELSSLKAARSPSVLWLLCLARPCPN